MLNIPKSLLFLICFILVPVAQASVDVDKLGGRVEAVTPEGDTLVFPTLKTDINVDIQGDLATVEVQQTFQNPLNTPLNVSYLFPLNKDAAVYKMIMEVGDEQVRAEIKKVEEAQATFNKAKKEGKSAALLKQHRPNMFTQDIANLMPGLPIKVTLHYVQTLPKVDNAYELVLPLVVGPRFQPPHAGKVPEKKTGEFGKWELEALPSYPSVTGLDIPKSIEAERVAIKISLNGGMPIQQVSSQTHKINTETAGDNQRIISLAKNRVIDNRDFVLRYSLNGENNQAGLLAHYNNEQQGFFSLLIEPPAIPKANQITPREMVFVLDCSGSMSGLPLNTSKAFMREALQNLRPTDTFRIIRFSGSASEFSSAPLPATTKNIQNGISYTNSLRGTGGTMMTEGIKKAFNVPVPEGSMRLVVFLTDGYIGNEHEVLSLIKKIIGSARLFALGVGTGLNRFLLSEMGHVGRGFTRYMDPTEKLESVAKELAQRLQSPVLTDITIDWGDLKATQLMPEKVSDLFAGQSIRIQGRYAKPGRYAIKVKGYINERPATLPLEILLPGKTEQGEAIPLIWARSAIKEKMRLFDTPKYMRPRKTSGNDLKQQVTQLGLNFSLVTKWTAFVATSEKIYNPNPAHTPTSEIPLPMVEGVSKHAYGNKNQAQPAPAISYATPNQAQSQNKSFSGNAVPEPAMLFGLFLILMILGWFLKNRALQN